MAVRNVSGINAAQETYNQSSSGGGNNVLLPRSRFQFTTTIKHIGSSVPNPLKLLRVSEVQLPGHIFRTAILNQYNRKRIVNTGIEYTPIYINAYDTRDAEIEKFLKEYSTYYFKGPMETDGAAELNYSDLTTLGFATGNSGKGLNLVPEKSFIKEIEIERRNGDDKNLIRVFAPTITGISGDTMNYSDSNPAQVRIEISYEGYSIESL
jgi:hypothetical protein